METPYSLQISKEQARLLYYALIKSGMGDSQVTNAKDLLEKLDKICNNP